MLPNQTNRYGDLLREFYTGMKDGSLSEVRLAEIQRVFNELAQRENVYKAWLSSSEKIDFSHLNLPFMPIYSVVLEEDKSDLTVAIPSGFHHLMIMGQGRVNGTGGQIAVYVYAQFNGDTGSNYLLNILYQAAAVVSSTEDLSNAGIPFAYMAGDGGDANYNGSFVTYIPHYNSGYFKTSLSLDGVARDASTSIAIWQGVWKNTSKITEIKIYPDPAYVNAKLESGSLISIYGIF